MNPIPLKKINIFLFLTKKNDKNKKLISKIEWN